MEESATRSYRKVILLAQTSRKSLSERAFVINKMKCLSKRTLTLIQYVLSTMCFYHFRLLGLWRLLTFLNAQGALRPKDPLEPRSRLFFL